MHEQRDPRRKACNGVLRARPASRRAPESAHTHRSISAIVNDAVRLSLREDQEDLAAFEDRVAEPVMSYEALLKDLKAHGKL